jgi:hypothetical protein
MENFDFENLKYTHNYAFILFEMKIKLFIIVHINNRKFMKNCCIFIKARKEKEKKKTENKLKKYFKQKQEQQNLSIIYVTVIFHY